MVKHTSNMYGIVLLLWAFAVIVNNRGRPLSR